MLYRLGLDIGIGSVGYSILQNNPLTEEPEGIVKLGVRVFDSNEIQKTGESTASKRRNFRGIRRLKRRKQLRIHKLKLLLKNEFGVTNGELESINNKDVYEIRSTALDSKISLCELTKVILNIAKHRGFKSNRKSESKNNKDTGALLSAMTENQKYLSESVFRTFGEAIFKDKNKFSKNGYYIVRNRGGDYKNCFYRDDLKNELELILKKQQEYYPQITDEFIENLVNIFEKQRNFDEGPGEQSPYKASFEVGDCTFIKSEKRAPKASFTFEYFTALSRINSLRINDVNLSDELKQTLISKIRTSKELTFAQVRKILDIPLSSTFNLCHYNIGKKSKNKDGLSQEELIKECEKSKFVSMANSFEISKVLGLSSGYENQELVDECALMLSLKKSDEPRIEYIKSSLILNKLTEKQISGLLELNYDKFGSLSIKAMKEIIPFLEEGQGYSDACKSAGYNHSSSKYDKMKYLKGEEIDERLENITSPVAKRAINQTLKVVNEIIKKYGSPQFVNIELARELSKKFDERMKTQKLQSENEAKNDAIVKRLEEHFGITKASGLDIVKFKLYEEQGGKCIYSGKDIDFNRLLESNYLQVDHILPYSRSFDDTMANKVLVLSKENQDKGNQTPFEYFGNNESSEKWLKFVAQVNSTPNLSSKKRRNLLKTSFSTSQSEDFIKRNLVDTQYISRELLSLFQDYLQFEPSAKYKKQVKAINGAVTSYLRKLWGINKIREDGDIHHSIDATVIAVTSEGMIQKITSYNKFKEQFVFDEKQNVYISRFTGEVMNPQDKQKYETEQFINFANKKAIPAEPYPNFRQELELRSKAKYKDFSYNDEEQNELIKFGYDAEELGNIKPIFVSRMKTTKKTGAIHQETIMSLREYDETKNLIKSVTLNNIHVKDGAEEIALKGDKYPDKHIENYYKPQDDRLLYLALKEHLVEQGDFKPNEKFYKPKSDGTPGPLVKKVKIYQYASNIVKLPQGGASNDKMYRVDVYKKGGKYFLCPVYMADVYAHKYPNKVIIIGKDWETIDDTFDFQFSLYKNDLIKIKSKGKISLSRNFNNPKSKKPDKIEANELLVYYNSTGISTASFRVITHDNCYAKDSLGVKTLLSIEKYYVDIMGNIYKATKEKFQEI